MPYGKPDTNSGRSGDSPPPSSTHDFFQPGRNCWRPTLIKHGTLLVDCADFYRALHSAIVKARESIFIVGWDIDSRIPLLRGEDAVNAPAPSVAGDLLSWKARQNPDLKIYLLRWDASIAFMGQRELKAKKVWEAMTPENVHFWLDRTIPAGGSHHQKIIVVDNEVAFTGGMDIAPQRWDEREHRPHEPDRKDADGAYGPYHDIQIVVDGPVVKDLAELAHWRWRHATGFDSFPLTYQNIPDNRLPDAWPDGFTPQFTDFDCALARTIPWMGQHPETFEVRQMYVDLINQAEHFIYCENQFFTYLNFAETLNKRLKERPDLKVLLVSSYNPQGLFECEGMWSGRIDFKRVVSAGIEPGRLKMMYPAIYDDEDELFYKRIHSKIMAVDDRFLTVASSNIDNRSMTLDTECDLVLQAHTDSQKRNIANTRNDLIAEHSGLEMAEIEKQIKSGTLLKALEHSGGQKTLYDINDKIFTDQKLQHLVGPLTDPARPLLPSVYSLNPGEIRPMKNPKKNMLLIGAVGLVLLAIATSMFAYADWISPEKISHFLQTSRGTVWALPAVCLVYVVGGLVMFPVTVLSLATAAVFGPLLGPIYAMCGALLSGALLFWLGHLAGLRGLRKLIGERVRKVDAMLKEKGLLGIVTVRLVPIAPYSLVNLVAGISSIRFADFILGTFLGLLPGLIAKGFVGDSLVQLFISPSRETAIYAASGIAFWALMVVGAQRLVRRLQKRAERKKQENYA